jgi:hypothetical protein
MSEPQPATCYTTASLHVQTTDQLNTLPPPWLAEALLIAQLWCASGLVERLQQFFALSSLLQRFWIVIAAPTAD